MKFRWFTLCFFAITSLFLFSCQNNEIGEPCTVSVCGVNDPSDNANTICTPNTKQCPNSTLCLGEGQGLGTGVVDEYCTDFCDVDNANACPDGFACVVAVEVGESFAGDTFCLKVRDEEVVE